MQCHVGDVKGTETKVWPIWASCANDILLTWQLELLIIIKAGRAGVAELLQNKCIIDSSGENLYISNFFQGLIEGITGLVETNLISRVSNIKDNLNNISINNYNLGDHPVVGLIYKNNKTQKTNDINIYKPMLYSWPNLNYKNGAGYLEANYRF